jgi:small redox-active disulfide protein 2
MRIEILGSGCAKCKQLYANAEEAVASSGAQAELVKIEDFAEIAKRGVMTTPALSIDGVVKSAGRVVRSEEIAAWL